MPRHIMSLKSVPLEATRAPVMVKRLFDSMKPAALVAKPLKALRSDTMTGMSAPPMGSTIFTPSPLQMAVFNSKLMAPRGVAYNRLEQKIAPMRRLLPTPIPFSIHRFSNTTGLPGIVP